MKVIYHENLGTKTDYGYGYKVVEDTEVAEYVKQGWYQRSIDVPTNIHRVAAESEEEALLLEVDPPASGPGSDPAAASVDKPEAKKKGRPSKK